MPVNTLKAAWSLDADGHDPQLVERRDGLQGVRRSGRMRPSSYYDRIVDVMEELVRFTVLTRRHAEQLVDRYSEH